MTQHYPIQLITLDEVAHQALELASLSKFDQILKSDLEKLSSVLVKDHHHILVLSQLTEKIAEIVTRELGNSEDPIVILPDTVQETEELKQLLLSGIRVIIAPSDTLLSISLSRILEIIQSLFYGNETESEIDLEHSDIYEVIQKGTTTELHESSGTDLSTTMMRLFNLPRRLDDVAGAIILFTVHEDRSILEISEAMDVAEAQLPEESYVLFATRNNSSDLQSGTITALISRYYDFEQDLQKEIDQSSSYLGKASVIVDAFAQGVISGQEADLLAERNSLDTGDVKAIYTMLYEQPEETAKLIKMLADEKIDQSRKIEAVADVIVDESVNIDIAGALVDMKQLSVDDILTIVDLKKEGKLPLQSLEIPGDLKGEYADLKLARSADTLVLLAQNDLRKEESGTLSVKTDELKVYEKDGVEWYVSKNLEQDVIDAFVGEYELP
jgi:vacuolar-type H+-ATPase subunit F/Vma7